VLAFLLGGAAYAYIDIQNNITSIDVNALVSSASTPSETTTPTPDPTYDDPNAGRALNILVMGSDERTGENGELGGVDDQTVGMRSDTTLLVHVSADRTRIEAVSIPRDLKIPIPSCPLPDGSSTSSYADAMFNSAIAQGSQQSETGSDEAKQFGVACTVLTVQAMTGITVDEYVLVDFAGFKNMVDAIGGVDVCLAEPLWDNYTGLDLPAGAQKLDGQQALQLARARHNIGDGGDIGRIDRQQQLLSVMLAEVMEKNLLTNASELYRFLSAATQSLTTSPGLAQIPSLVGLATSMRGISMDAVDFVTIPVTEHRNDRNRLQLADNADEVWAALAMDQPLSTVLPELASAAENAGETETADSTATADTTAVAGTATPESGGATDATTAETTAPEPTEDATPPRLISRTC